MRSVTVNANVSATNVLMSSQFGTVTVAGGDTFAWTGSSSITNTPTIAGMAPWPIPAP